MRGHGMAHLGWEDGLCIDRPQAPGSTPVRAFEKIWWSLSLDVGDYLVRLDTPK
jgi:hypothetical protein